MVFTASIEHFSKKYIGDYKRAVPELERAVQLRPNDATINDHLGDAYWKVGRKLEARFQWDKAKSMKLDASHLESINQKLWMVDCLYLPF